MTVDAADAEELVGACAAPSEAFWRLLELEAVRDAADLFREPVLELGCGDGTFTRLTGISVAVGSDRGPRAVERARAQGPYERTLRLDVHDLAPDRHGRFATVWANSVLEHVDGLQHALPRIRAALEPGGRLVATVPLAEMDRHLAVGGARYTAWRQNQLEHRNLWSKVAWEQCLRDAGFDAVEWRDYLPADACRTWDRADVLGALGRGRYRLAPAAHHAARRLVPAGARALARRRIAAELLEVARERTSGPSCAALLCAIAPA